MDLIDRYLDAVRLFLPRDQRDDIAAELRDVLVSRREDRQAELGRPLTRKEDQALLQDFGHPLAVAARYGRQQYLIGPELYPIYAFVLKIVLAAIGVAALITGVVTAAVGTPTHAIGAALDVAWSGAFTSVGVVTIIFAALQRSDAGRRIVGGYWTVGDLPRVARRRRRGGWSEHVAGLVVQTLFILWWIGAIGPWPAVLPLKTGGVLQFAFAPALQGLYLPVLALSAGAIAVHALKLAGRDVRAIAYGVDTAVQAAVIAAAGFALHGGLWVVVTGVGVPAQVLIEANRGVNIGAEVSLIVAVCASVVRLAYDAWRLARPEPAGLRAAGGA